MVKPWKKKKRGRRNKPNLARRTVLLLCEDSKTSPLYFSDFPFDENLVSVKTFGKGMNTVSLVNKAINYSGEAVQKGVPFNEIWCIFDRDNFPRNNYLRAFDLARDNRIQVAWANECFELWYLLHFHYRVTGLSRKGFQKLLTKLLGFKYKKNLGGMYETLLGKQDIAIQYADKLLASYSGIHQPHLENPSTNIQELVKFLNQFIPDTPDTDCESN